MYLKWMKADGASYYTHMYSGWTDRLLVCVEVGGHRSQISWLVGKQDFNNTDLNCSEAEQKELEPGEEVRIWVREREGGE